MFSIMLSLFLVSFSTFVEGSFYAEGLRAGRQALSNGPDLKGAQVPNIMQSQEITALQNKQPQASTLRTEASAKAKTPPWMGLQTPERDLKAEIKKIAVERKERVSSFKFTAETACGGQPCWHAKETQNTEFQSTLAALSVWREAARDNINAFFFAGTPSRCRVAVNGFLNCCTDRGWGKKWHLSECSEEEKALALAKAKGETVFIGRYCHQKTLGQCVEKRQSYCRFHSKLARALQASVHAQLGLSWGSVKAPQCQGLTQALLEKIDWGKIDLSAVLESTALPTPEISRTKRLPKLPTQNPLF